MEHPEAQRMRGGGRAPTCRSAPDHRARPPFAPSRTGAQSRHEQCPREEAEEFLRVASVELDCCLRSFSRQAACCFGSAAISACCCRSCSCKHSTVTRIAYAILLFVITIVAWLMLNPGIDDDLVADFFVALRVGLG